MKLYVKLSKCRFWLIMMSFLGHVILDKSIVVYPSEVDAVLQWETPKLVFGLSWLLPQDMRGFTKSTLLLSP